MVVGRQHVADEVGPEQDKQHPLDQFVRDPSGSAPLCDEARFAEIVAGMVADAAPGIFAVVQEYGQRVDARITAWGMAFDDHAEVVSVCGTVRMRTCAPEDALLGFHFGTHVRARLVWFGVDAAARDADEG